MRVTSEGPTKITKATIEAAWRRRKPEHRLIVRDKDCRGLALIVNPTSMAWSYGYRPRGTDAATGRRWPNRTVTFGNPATHSVDDARIEANRLKGRTAAGGDPAAERKAAAVAARTKRSGTVVRLAESYAQALPKRQKMRGGGRPSPRYVSEELSQLRLAIDEMGVAETAAAELTATDVRRLLGGDGNRRSRFSALSRFLDWCQDAGHIPANPCALTARARRPSAYRARANYLSPAELARLWHAAGALRQPVWRDLARFLMAVPCRRGEAARLDWSQLDLATAEWRQPGHMTKNRDPHRLRLNALALEVMRDRRNATGGKGLVFPAPKSGGAVDTFSDIKAALVGATKPEEGEDGPALAGWTWHDFRRSFATALGEAGVPEAVADAILNHRQSATRGGVLGVYQRASRWPEQAKAMESWGRLLADAIEGLEAEANVVPMTARAG
jgi:integrase